MNQRTELFVVCQWRRDEKKKLRDLFSGMQYLIKPLTNKQLAYPGYNDSNKKKEKSPAKWTGRPNLFHPELDSIAMWYRIQAMMHVENTIELITDSLWEVSLSIRYKIEGLQKLRGKRWSSVATFYPSFLLIWRRLITTTFLRPPFQCAPKCAISRQNAQLRAQKKLNEYSTSRTLVQRLLLNKCWTVHH